MKAFWYWNRLKSMSFEEIIMFRIPQFINSNIILRCLKKSKRNCELRVKSEFSSPTYSIEDINELFTFIPWEYNYRFFNSRVDLNEQIKWRKDYWNNKESEVKFYSNINRQNFSKIGDIKYVSELNRMHFLPFMAFHYINTNRIKELENIERLLKTWENQNPFLKSINYTSGIEVGIRSLNIIYTHLVLKHFALLTEELDNIIKRLIYNNYIFLKNNLSLYSSANNHLVGELMGLVVISSYFEGPDLNQKKWERKFIRLLKAKYNPDGIDDELSTRYHLTVTDHFLNGVLFLKRSGHEIDPESIEILKKSFKYIEHIKFNGVETFFGDNDDSLLINPFFQKNFSLPQSLIDSYQFEFNKSKSEELDFRNYLIFGSDYYRANKYTPLLPETTFFENSGYAFIYNHHFGLKLTFDCGNIGDNRMMAHGHSDQLGFTLQLDDFMFLVDTGTYQYHIKEEKWRNYFRGVKAHNTISINGKDQALSLGRMSWRNASKATIKEFSSQNGIERISAKIDGFKKDGVIHTRILIHDGIKQLISIEDLLEIEGDNSDKVASFYLHFHPQAQVKQDNQTITLLSPKGRRVNIFNNLFKDAKLIRGNKEMPLGWFSKSYDNIQETTSLLLELNITCNTKITTHINY